MMDMNAVIVVYNEKIVVEAEKIDGNEDERQCDTQMTGKEESDPSCPNNSITGPVVRSTSNGEADDHSTVLTVNVNVNESCCPQNNSQISANSAPDSIMEVPVTTEAMDMTAEDVSYNEKIVVETEKIDGNEDERQCDSQVTGKGESDPSCPNNSIMSCENNTGSEATCNKLNLLNLDVDKFTPDLTFVKQEPDCQETNKNLVTNDNASTGPVVRSTSNGEADDHSTVLTVNVNVNESCCPQNNSQISANSAPDSIMEVPEATEAMDMTAEDVSYNEKIVIKTEKIDGNEDERQCDTQVTGKGQSDPPCPNSIMSCENNTSSEAACNKLNLLNLDVGTITPDLAIVKQEPDCQETNKNLVTNDNASTDSVVRSTSNGEADDHGTVLTTSKKSDALSSLTVYRTNVSDDDGSGGDSGTADSDDDSSSGSSSSSSSSSSDSDDEASDSGNDARYIDLPLGRLYTERKLEDIPLRYVLPACQPYLFWWPPLGVNTGREG